jgi:hypothetical protein
VPLRPGRVSAKRAVAVCAIAAGAALGAGCGGSGGGDSTEEEALRTQMEQGFEKVANANALDVSLDFQVGLDEESSLETTGGCLKLTIDQGKPGADDDEVEMRAIENGCDGAAVQARIIAIGRDVYVSKGPGSSEYSPGRIDPSVLTELTDDTAEFNELPEAAEDISGDSRKIEFKAPASAFASAGELEGEDVDVDFETSFDEQGNLRLLVGNIEAEGATATVTVTYDNIDQTEPITAPAKSEVVGEVQQIHSQAELESLFEGPLGNAF